MRRRVRGAAPVRYGAPAIVMHWAIAICVLVNLAVGFFMEDFREPWRGAVTAWHYSCGMTVLGLAAPRLLWRMFNPPPPNLWNRLWERHLARGVHVALYAAMFLMPLLGWAILSAHPPAGSAGARQRSAERAAVTASLDGKVQARRFGTSQAHRIWGVLPLPSLSPIEQLGAKPSGLGLQARLHQDLVRLHTAGGVVMLLLVALHLSGAFKHEWLDGQGSLARMGLPRMRPSPEPPPDPGRAD